jgi:hypothetical protein
LRQTRQTASFDFLKKKKKEEKREREREREGVALKANFI